MSAVRLDRNGLVATVTLDRPEQRNALDRELMIELTQMISALSYDGTRVIVITGAGKAFCAGADLEWMRRARDFEHDANVADAGIARTLFETIDACPRAVIAKVNGHALGGGAGIVACADLAVASLGTQFGFTETRLGLIPATISPYVLRTIGPGHARALFTTGERFDAERALQIGLVHRVVERAQLEHAVADCILAYLACGPDAIAASKQLLRDATAGLALTDLAERLAVTRAGNEAREGMDAFLGKRPPAWSPESPAS
ncbi:MAG TPA: enoyl-CoA hydratase-related protein [Gaiellales bacterium]